MHEPWCCSGPCPRQPHKNLGFLGRSAAHFQSENNQTCASTRSDQLALTVRLRDLILCKSKQGRSQRTLNLIRLPTNEKRNGTTRELWVAVPSCVQKVCALLVSPRSATPLLNLLVVWPRKNDLRRSLALHLLDWRRRLVISWAQHACHDWGASEAPHRTTHQLGCPNPARGHPTTWDLAHNDGRFLHSTNSPVADALNWGQGATPPRHGPLCARTTNLFVHKSSYHVGHHGLRHRCRLETLGRICDESRNACRFHQIPRDVSVHLLLSIDPFYDLVLCCWDVIIPLRRRHSWWNWENLMQLGGRRTQVFLYSGDK